MLLLHMKVIVEVCTDFLTTNERLLVYNCRLASGSDNEQVQTQMQNRYNKARAYLVDQASCFNSTVARSLF